MMYQKWYTEPNAQNQNHFSGKCLRKVNMQVGWHWSKRKWQVVVCLTIYQKWSSMLCPHLLLKTRELPEGICHVRKSTTITQNFLVLFHLLILTNMTIYTFPWLKGKWNHEHVQSLSVDTIQHLIRDWSIWIWKHHSKSESLLPCL